MDRVAALERQLAEQQAAERERTLAAREESLKRYQDFERALREKDVIEALSSLGYSFDDISRAAIERRGVETEATKVSKDVSALRDEIRQLREAREQEQQAAALAQTHREINETIAARSPLLSVYGDLGRDAVLTHIREEYSRSGGRVVPTYEQAVSAVESEFKSLVTKALTVETIRSQFLPTNQPPQTASGNASETATPVTPGRPPTISNEHATSVGRRAEADQPLTDEERLAKALSFLE